MQIAILHFNENANRDQAITMEGEERFDVLFPKYKAGGYVVKKVKVDPTFSKLIPPFLAKFDANPLTQSMLRI